jgi:hypothetical protein
MRMRRETNTKRRRPPACRWMLVGAVFAAVTHSAYVGVHAQEGQSGSIRLRSGRHGHVVLPVEDGWLLCGGFAAESRNEDRGSHDAFWCDSKTHRWRELPPMNVGKAFFGAAVVEGRAYVVGGNIERFDPVEERWEVVCSEPALPTSHFSAACIDSKLLIVSHRLFVFDTKTGKLASRDLWPTRRRGDHFHIVAALDGELHVIGGLDGETFDPRREHWVWNGTQWKQLADAPVAMFAKFSVVQVVERRLYVMSNDASYAYDAGQWTALARMPTTICMPGSIVASGKFQLVGGLTSDRSSPRLTYDIASDRWSDH